MSDSHFGHTNLEQFGERSGNWQEQIWKGIEDLPKDVTLIHLGDMCIGDDKEAHERLIYVTTYLQTLILVRGNHDKKSLSFYNKYWEFVCDSFELIYGGEYIHFSHRPQPPMGHFTKNIHGHTHGAMHHSEEYISYYDKDYHIDVSPEIVGYKPVKLETLLCNTKK